MDDEPLFAFNEVAAVTKKKVVVFAGPPLSGKSELSSWLASSSGGPRFAMDEIRKEILPLSNHTADDRACAYDEVHLRAHDALTRGSGLVILDATYRPAEQRATCRELARAHDATVYLIECKVPPREARRRFGRRRSGHAAKDLTFEKVERIAKDHRYFGLGLLLDTSSPHNICIREITKYIEGDGLDSTSIDEWAVVSDSDVLDVSQHDAMSNQLTALSRKHAARRVYLAALLCVVSLGLLCAGVIFAFRASWNLSQFLLTLGVIAGAFLPLAQWAIGQLEIHRDILEAALVPHHSGTLTRTRPRDTLIYFTYLARLKHDEWTMMPVPGVPVYFAVPVGRNFSIQIERKGDDFKDDAVRMAAASHFMDWDGFRTWYLDMHDRTFKSPINTRLVRMSKLCVDGTAIKMKVGKCTYRDRACTEGAVNTTWGGGCSGDLRRLFEGDAWDNKAAMSLGQASDRYAMAIAISLLIITDDGYLVLQVRSKHVSHGAGGVAASVVGYAHWDDQDLIHTAQREANEELGIAPDELSFCNEPFIGAAYNLLHGRDLNVYAWARTRLRFHEISQRIWPVAEPSGTLGRLARVLNRHRRVRDAWEVARLIPVSVHDVSCCTGIIRSGYDPLYRCANRHLKGALYALARSGVLSGLKKQQEHIDSDQESKPGDVVSSENQNAQIPPRTPGFALPRAHVPIITSSESARGT